MFLIKNCGKLWFPKFSKYIYENSIKKLDAVILTHQHYDAIGSLFLLYDIAKNQNGLKIYLNDETLLSIKSV